MSTPPQVEPFKGKDWKECCQFVVAVRNRARWEGKQRDSEWIADFAAVNFDHKALLWHARLPQDVSENWKRLEVALLEQWPPPDLDDGCETEPTPAAAPSKDSPSQSPSAEGIIKVVLDSSLSTFYVREAPEDGVFRVTRNRKDALQLHYDSGPNTDTGLLRLLNASSHLFLAGRWEHPTPDLSEGSTHYITLLAFDPVTMKPYGPVDVSRGQWKGLTATLSANRELLPVWTTDIGSAKHLTSFVRPDNNVLYLAADPKAYYDTYSSEKRAKLFFEPINKSG